MRRSPEVDETEDNDGRVNSKRLKTTVSSNGDEQSVKKQSITTPLMTVLDKRMDYLAKAEYNLAGLYTFGNEEYSQNLEGIISFMQNDIANYTT